MTSHLSFNTMGPFVIIILLIYMCVYIYIYREREREREYNKVQACFVLETFYSEGPGRP